MDAPQPKLSSPERAGPPSAPPGTEQGSRPRAPWRLALLCALLALALRGAFAAVAYGRIAQDGVMYVDMARGVLNGSLTQTFHEQGTVLYPALIALFHLLIPDIEAAALTVSVVLSALTVIPTFFLARRLAGDRAAVWSALFVALSPALNSSGAQVLTEATFGFLLVLAALFGCGLVVAPTVRTALGFSVACGAAYLARQEVLLLVVVTLVAVLVRPAWRRYRRERVRWQRGLAALVVAGLAFAPFVGIQAAGLYVKTGTLYLFSKGASVPPISPAARDRYDHHRWSLTADEQHVHKDVMLQPKYRQERPDLSEPPRRWARYWLANLWEYLADAPKVIGFAAAPFTLVGFLAALAGRRGTAGRYLSLFLLAYVLCLAAGYPTRRFFVPLAPFTLVLGADALVALSAAVRQRWQRLAKAPLAGLALAALLTAQTAYAWCLERAGTFEDQPRAVGAWMRENLIPGPLMTRRARVPFYSGFPYVPLPVGARYDALLRYADHTQVRYLLIDVPDTFAEHPQTAWNTLLADPAWLLIRSWPWSRPGTAGKMLLLERTRPSGPTNAASPGPARH